jgi:Zn-dependent protease with chaperone function
VAAPALRYPSFQEPAAVGCPRNALCRVDVSHDTRPSEPRLLPTCERFFIPGSKVTERDIKPKLAHGPRSAPCQHRMKHLRPSFSDYARRAICATVVLFCALPVRASDTQVSSDANVVEQTSTSAVSKSQAAVGPEEKKEKAYKYNIDRIGQRDIGKGVNLYSLQKERALGEAMAAAIDRRTKFVADLDINDYVNRLGQKIARNSDAQVHFTIKVIDSPDFTTFALPGGFLYVAKGLIMEVDSEAELAGLMAHEIAHVAARHATRFATQKSAWNLISVPLASLGPAGLGARQIGPLSLKKFSRDAELEADLLGMEYQYAAGYDPQAFVDALEKLHSKEIRMRARANAQPKVGFLARMPLPHQIAQAYASYPPTEERILKVQMEISALLPGRDDYIFDTSEFQEVKAKIARADRPILRRHRPGDSLANGPVLHRHPSPEPRQPLELRATAASEAESGNL